MRPTGRLAKLCALAALVLVFERVDAFAGEVRGRVSVPPGRASAPTVNAYPGQLSADHAASHGMAGASRSAASASDAVVSLVPVSGVPASALREAGERGPHSALRQTHQAFVPRVLPILVGTTVDFPNDDPFYHNVFSYSAAKRFDLGRYGKGKFESQTFDRPGLVKVFCDIHSDMAAFIVVLDTPYFASPASRGAYVVSDLPPGEYAVTVWHPDFAEWKGSVNVPADGAVALDVELR